MTREEAIMVLKNEQPHRGKRALFPEEKKYEAFNVAVKALEHPEQNVMAVVPCGDAISRAAVLEKAINVPIAKVVTEDKVIYRKIVFADDIENLPSVTPKPETVTEFADRCRECGRERVLVKIRDEIEDVAFDWQEIDGEYESFMVVDLNDALQIIDKYKAEREE